jgi:hypothetical protein
LKEKVAGSVKKIEITAEGIRCADHAASLSPQKLVLTSSTSGGRSVGLVRSRTKATELLLLLLLLLLYYYTNATVRMEGLGNLKKWQ